MKKKILKNKRTSETKPKTEKRTPKVAPAIAKQETVSQVIVGLHNLKVPRGAHKRRRIKGRGSSSGHGKTSTRGSKGQTSRSGRATYPGFEGGQTSLIRRMPKRGFVSRDKLEYQIVNLNELNRIKEENISLDLLKERGLIKDNDKFKEHYDEINHQWVLDKITVKKEIELIGKNIFFKLLKEVLDKVRS